jgi:parallel beta-helix repeat protein
MGFSVGTTDGCPFWCAFLGSGDCHSHAPLIDNVRLVRDFSPPLTVTNTYTLGPGSLRQAVNEANSTEERDTIRFDIPGPGPHVIYEVASIRFSAFAGPVVVDATTQPGYSGTPVVIIDGGARTQLRGVQVFGDSSVVRGLEIRNFEFEGLTLDGTRYTVVEKNEIHHNGTGILMRNSASNNMIGGVTPDLGNVIADNTGDGITVFETGAIDNSFLCNSIARNGGLGIDLSNVLGGGVTPNDPQDPDTGPNQFQNFPTMRWASSELSTIGASLNSIPNSSFTIQFFSSPACDGSGNGEGENYLGSTQVTTDAFGDVDFTVTTQPFTDVEYLSATATDTSGSTSEFSPCFLASPASAVGDQPVTRAALYPAAPNPFNPFTVIRYDVPGAGADVTIVVYDVTGRRVATLVDGYQSGGRKLVTWNGRNNHGNRVATGLYFYRMTAPGFEMTKKMLLLQ